MAKSPTPIDELYFAPSLFDRLTDDAPERKIDPPRASGRESLDRLVRSLTRDLEAVLNTRRPMIPISSNTPELKQSVLGYGLDDPSGPNMASEDGRAEICRRIEATIRTYESRLHRVKVTMLKNAESLDRTLRFRVEGVIHSVDMRSPVVFDSQIEPGRCKVHVKHAS